MKGDRRPKPSQAAAAAAALAPLDVGWSGGTRRVSVLTDAGHWYKAGHGLVPVRWVFVRDTTGTHRDESFFTTDLGLTPAAVIGSYGGRWNIEKDQADCPSRRRWGGGRRAEYHRDNGDARAGRVVPATSGRSHRRSRMPDPIRRPVPPRA